MAEKASQSPPRCPDAADGLGVLQCHSRRQRLGLWRGYDRSRRYPLVVRVDSDLAGRRAPQGSPVEVPRLHRLDGHRRPRAGDARGAVAAGAGTMVSPVGFWKCEAYIADWGPTYPADKAPGGPFLNATTITSFDPATGTYSGVDIAWGIGRETVTGTFNSNNDTQDVDDRRPPCGRPRPRKGNGQPRRDHYHERDLGQFDRPERHRRLLDERLRAERDCGGGLVRD